MSELTATCHSFSNDATQTGYVLGDAQLRTGVVAPERTLFPPAVCIVRAIMHSALIWYASHHTDCIADLAGLVHPHAHPDHQHVHPDHPHVHPDHLPEFFWSHLQKDIQQLSATIGRNEDVAAVLVHLCLKNILTMEPPTNGTLSNS